MLLGGKFAVSVTILLLLVALVSATHYRSCRYYLSLFTFLLDDLPLLQNSEVVFINYLFIFGDGSCERTTLSRLGPKVRWIILFL